MAISLPQIAPFTRRATAHLVDLLLMIMVLTAFGLLLPVAPPPVGAMAFYSDQDFTNYFTLAMAWIAVISILYFLIVLRMINRTPGMWLIGLKYMGLNGHTPGPVSIRRRYLGALFYSLIILVPGPVIALVIGLITHSLFSVPLTTAADMLNKIGVPGLAQLAIHSVSFMALFVGMVYVHRQLSHKSQDSNVLRASWYDEKCGCTIVVER